MLFPFLVRLYRIEVVLMRSFRIGAFMILLIVILFASVPLPAQTYKALHAFGAGTDGGGPWASVVFNAHGKLYGSTSGGGTHGYGTVFKLTQMPNGEWSESILHNFPISSSDGQISIWGGSPRQ